MSTGEATRVGLGMLILVAGRLLAIVFSFVQAAIIVSCLGTERFGHFSFAWGLTSILTVFATLGLQRILVRIIARKRETPWDTVWPAVAMVVVLSLTTTALLLMVERGLDPNLPRRAAVTMAALWIIVLWAMQQPFEALLMARERMATVSVLYLIVAAAKVLLVWWLVRGEATGATAHLALALASAGGLLIFVAAAIQEAGWRAPRVRWPVVRSLFRECLPLVPAMIFMLIYFKSDIVIVGWMLGDAPVGVYGLVQRVTEPLMMVAAILGAALFPALCRLSGDGGEKAELLKKTAARFVLLVSLPMGTGLAAVAGPVVALLARDKAAEFAESVNLMRMMCVVIPFFYFNGIVLEFLYAAHRDWFVAKVAAAAALVSVVGNVLLIPRLGVAAAPVTAVVVNAMISGLFYWKVRADLGRIAMGGLLVKSLGACALMGAAAWWLSGYHLAAGVLAGVLIYPLAQWLLRTLDPMERHLVGRVLTAVLRR